MIRYIATRIAHEKNPYTRGSSDWEQFNIGYVRGVMPTIPSRWEIALTSLYLLPIILPSVVLLLFLR